MSDEKYTTVRIKQSTLEKLHSFQDNCVGNPSVGSLADEAVEQLVEGDESND